MSEPDIPSVAREICAKSTLEPTSSSEQINYKKHGMTKNGKEWYVKAWYGKINTMWSLRPHLKN